MLGRSSDQSSSRRPGHLARLVLLSLVRLSFGILRCGGRLQPVQVSTAEDGEGPDLATALLGWISLLDIPKRRPEPCGRRGFFSTEYNSTGVWVHCAHVATRGRVPNGPVVTNGTLHHAPSVPIVMVLLMAQPAQRHEVIPAAIGIARVDMLHS